MNRARVGGAVFVGLCGLLFSVGLALVLFASCTGALTSFSVNRVDSKPMLFLPNNARQGQSLFIEVVFSDLQSGTSYYVSELPEGSGIRVVRYYSKSCDQVGETTVLALVESDANDGSETTDSDAVDLSDDGGTTGLGSEYHACFEIEVDSNAPLGVQMVSVTISDETGQNKFSGTSPMYIFEPLQ